MRPMNFPGKARIVPYTIVHEVPTPFTRQKPYILAIIKLDEGPSLTGQVVDSDPEEVDMGKRVHSVFRKVAEDGKSGIIQYGYKFVLD